MHLKGRNFGWHSVLLKVTIMWCSQSIIIWSWRVCCETGWFRRPILFDRRGPIDRWEARNFNFACKKSVWIQCGWLFWINCADKKYSQTGQYQDWNKMQTDVNWQRLLQEAPWSYWRHPDEEHGEIQKIHGSMRDLNENDSILMRLTS